MTKHPFRIAIESGATQADFAKLFSPDAVLLAPMLSKPVIGVSHLLSVIGHAAQVAGPIQYTLEVSDSKQTFLLWKGQVKGFPLEAATILVDGADGLIHEVRVLMRSWPVVTLFRDAMYQLLSATIPQDYWELGPKPADAGGPRQFTSIALTSIETAPDMALHSPILAKSVSGKQAVDAALKLAHAVQTRSCYTSIVATPELIIEVFDCDADGHPMEGTWIQKLNGRGQIYDLTVMLRPYPAVTVLRNRAKDISDRQGILGKEFWELPASAPTS
jgi:hypothetical protein